MLLRLLPSRLKVFLSRSTSLATLTMGFSLGLGSAAAGPLDAVLLKDLYTGSSPQPLNADDITPVGNKIFFTVHTPTEGKELWISDGTANGTKLVKDINPGLGSSFIENITAAGTNVYFSANDGVNGQELWVSDGTANGTEMVADLTPTEGQSSKPTSFYPLGTGVVFIAQSSFYPVGLWWTNGTPANTRLLKELSPADLSEGQLKGGVAATNFYFCVEKDKWVDLWKTNGTVAGTVLVKSLNFYIADVLGAAGTNLFYTSYTAETGWELYKTNGTEAGTGLVKDINPGLAHSDPGSFSTVNGKGYFLANTTAEGRELWVTDGTETGTQQFFAPPPSDNVPVIMDSGVSSAIGLGKFILISRRGLSPNDVGSLWSYDTSNSTSVKIFDCGAYGSVLSTVNFGGKVYFSANNEVGDGTQWLWSTNGTAAGTALVAPTIKGSRRISIDSHSKLYLAGTQIFFEVPDGLGGYELWKTKGADTAASTGKVKDGPVQPNSSNPRSFIQEGGNVYFSAYSPDHGNELWISDGTATGTYEMENLNPEGIDGAHGSNPSNFFAYGGKIYFSATTEEYGTELWVYDTVADVVGMVKDLHPGSNGSHPSQFFAFFTGQIGFVATTPDHGTELWITDGTTAGTEVADLLPGTSGSNPTGFVEASDYVYFSVTIANGKQQLVRTTDEDTSLVNVGSAFYSLHNLISSNGNTDGVYFFAKATENDPLSLYKLQSGSPVLVKSDFGDYPYLASVHSSSLGLLIERSADNGDHSFWLSDGTAEGTSIYRTYSGGRIIGVFNGKIYYSEALYDEEDNYLTENLMSLEESLDAEPVMELAGNSTSGQVNFVYFEESSHLTVFSRSVNYGKALLWANFGGSAPLQPLNGVSVETEGASPEFIRLDSYSSPKVLFSAPGATTGKELFVLNLAPSANVNPLQVQLVPSVGAPTALANNGSIQFPPTPRGQSSYVTVRLRNNAGVPLYYSSISFPNEGTEFTSTSPSFDLFPGEEVNVTLRFSPESLGAKTAPIEFKHFTLSTTTLKLTLKGTGLAESNKPILYALPLARITRTGEVVKFYSGGGSEPLTPESFVWKLGSKALPHNPEVIVSPGEPSSVLGSYVIPNVKLTDSGLYTVTLSNTSGSAVSTPTRLAVVQAAPSSTQVGEGKTLTLSATASGPAGGTLSYQWLRDDVVLNDIDNVRGSSTAKLTLTSITPRDEGDYDCRVTYTYNGVDYSILQGATEVDVIPLPVFAPVMLPSETQVGVTITPLTIIASNAVSFKATGLPPGLAISTGGVITGTATKSLGRDAAGARLPYIITVTATNVAGSTTQQIAWAINPLLPENSYEGLLDRNPAIDGDLGLGGRVKITSNTGGTMSGNVLLAGKTYAFSGLPTIIDVNGDIGATFSIPVSGKPAMTLQLYGDGDDLMAKLTATISNAPVSTTGIIRAAKFSAKVAATAYQGTHTWSFKPGVTTAVDYPKGSGYATVSVSAAGIATWTGKLADGSITTGSAPLCSSPFNPSDTSVFVALHTDLYKVTGSFRGVIEMATTAPVVATGSLSWTKKASATDRSYSTGFTLPAMTVSGGRYTPPATGYTVFGAFLDSATATHPVQVTVDGKETMLNLPFTFKLNNKQKATELLSDPGFKSVTFTPATGYFKATYSDLGPTAALNRSVTAEGVVLSLEGKAYGYLILPELTPETTTAALLNAAPLHSYNVTLDPDPLVPAAPVELSEE